MRWHPYQESAQKTTRTHHRSEKTLWACPSSTGYPKEFQEKQDTFRDRMDETLEAVKEAASENATVEEEAPESPEQSQEEA